MSTSVRRQRGLSLIELVVFMVIMGIAAAGVLQLLNLANTASADPVRRKQALMIAESLLEEVELARFTYCDPADSNAASATAPQLGAADCNSTLEGFGKEAGNARPYDNVNDYVAAAGVPQRAFDNAANQLVDAAGVVLDGGFSATLTIDAVPANINGSLTALGPANLLLSSTRAPAGMELLRITVVVSFGNGARDFVTLDGYRSRYAPRSLP